MKIPFLATFVPPSVYAAFVTRFRKNQLRSVGIQSMKVSRLRKLPPLIADFVKRAHLNPGLGLQLEAVRKDCYCARIFIDSQRLETSRHFEITYVSPAVEHDIEVTKKGEGVGGGHAFLDAVEYRSDGKAFWSAPEMDEDVVDAIRLLLDSVGRDPKGRIFSLIVAPSTG